MIYFLQSRSRYITYEDGKLEMDWQKIISRSPLKTQQKTVQYLDQLSQKTETLKQVQQEKMQSLKDLKASILDRAFRGEL